MKDDSAYRDLIHDTWNVLAVTYRLVSHLWSRELRRYGFTREQSLNLAIIKHLGDGATPWAISRFQVQAHNTVSGILSRMEKQGLITRIRESSGKSRVKIKLSEKGEIAYSKSLERKALNEVMSVLSPDELEQLKSILSKLRDAALVAYANQEREGSWPEIQVAPSQLESYVRDHYKKELDSAAERGSVAGETP